MEAHFLIGGGLLGAAGAGYLYWRHVWFFRNPPRVAPVGEGMVSPADGTVVYVKKVEPDEDVVVIKQGVSAKVSDILREDQSTAKLVIGVFMSPFDVHYNRSPLAGRVESICHHPAVGHNRHMAPMHWRTVLNRRPHYANSLHIVHNERKVTRIRGHYKGEELACYVVQIAARTVNGIDSYVREGQSVERGMVFGMIRVGSQVDLIIPWRSGMQARVQPGQRVRAGETVMVD